MEPLCNSSQHPAINRSVKGHSRTTDTHVHPDDVLKPPGPDEACELRLHLRIHLPGVVAEFHDHAAILPVGLPMVLEFRVAAVPQKLLLGREVLVGKPRHPGQSRYDHLRLRARVDLSNQQVHHADDPLVLRVKVLYTDAEIVVPND